MSRSTIKLNDIEYLSILKEDGSCEEDLLPSLSRDFLLSAYRYMLFTRRLDEQAVRYQRQGRIGTFAPSFGQEAAQIGSALVMTPEDWFVPSFRELGVALTRGLTVKNYLLFLMGFEEGNKDLKGSSNFPVSIPVGTQCTHAAGVAWGIKLDHKKNGTIVYFGDGATSEGDFHEGLNFCGALTLPCIFFCQNNQWAISTPRKKQTASETIAQKATAYGVPGIQVDGNDFFAVYVATREAFERARSGKGATLIEAITYRLGVHTTADDPTVYRHKDEEALWQKKDPLIRFKKFLIDKKMWDEEKEKTLEEALKLLIKTGYEEAENYRSSHPDPLAFFDHVYSTLSPYLKWQKALAHESIEGRNVIKGASTPNRGSGGAAAVGELEEAEE